VVFIPILLVVLCSLGPHCPVARRAPARRQPQRTLQRSSRLNLGSDRTNTTRFPACTTWRCWVVASQYSI